MVQTILYSTGCPKCKILKEVLDANNIPYIICDDIDIMMNKGFDTVPQLEVEGKILNFREAIDFARKI